MKKSTNRQLKKSTRVPIFHQLIKNYCLVMFSICLLPFLHAQENHQEIISQQNPSELLVESSDSSLKALDTLVAEIKQALTSKTLTAVERDQCYDIIGSLGLCRPVVQLVLERSPDITSQSLDVTSDASHHPEADHNSDLKQQSQNQHSEHAFDAIVSKFDLLKQQVVQQLIDQKIASNQYEFAYTLVGSLNLCQPILKGAGVLLDKMSAQTAEDQPMPTLASEQPDLALDSIEEMLKID